MTNAKTYCWPYNLLVSLSSTMEFTSPNAALKSGRWSNRGRCRVSGGRSPRLSLAQALTLDCQRGGRRCRDYCSSCVICPEHFYRTQKWAINRGLISNYKQVTERDFSIDGKKKKMCKKVVASHTALNQNIGLLIRYQKKIIINLTLCVCVIPDKKHSFWQQHS